MNVGEGSRTAVLVCQGRAVAHGRLAPGRFDDPTAVALLRGDELAAVEGARSGVVPKGFGARLEFERLRAVAEGMAPRTVAIDDAVRTRASPQLVILGAGLDGRAWRMAELASVDVFEVDHPTSQLDKRTRVGSTPPSAGTVRFVPVDFTRDRLDDGLELAGHRAAEATTWIWEGVVPYLTRSEVEATMGVVDVRSAPGSRLAVNYQAPSLAAKVGRVFARTVTTVARQADPMAHEPRRSAWSPSAMGDLLARYGFLVVSDADLLTLAGSLAIPVKNRRSLRSGRVCVADR